jgi:hypothetical protein
VVVGIGFDTSAHWCGCRGGGVAVQGGSDAWLSGRRRRCRRSGGISRFLPQVALHTCYY